MKKYNLNNISKEIRKVDKSVRAVTISRVWARWGENMDFNACFRAPHEPCKQGR